MEIIIFAIIGGIIVGIILVPIVLPLVMINNKKRLKEMDEKITRFKDKEFSSPEEKKKAKQQLKEELIEIKGKIAGDKNAVEKARDKISIL